MKNLLLFAVVLLLAAPAVAQDTATPVQPVEATEAVPVEKPAKDMGSLERRLELATKMHQFRSAREQVDSAVLQLARKMAPEKRELFKIGMRNVLNYKAIEKISIDAMAEIFTEKELEVMVTYYSTPEARAISEKYPAYQAKVSPQIVKMIDKAMMQVKTGTSP